MNEYTTVIFDYVFEDLETIFTFCRNRYGASYASKTIRKLLNESYSLDTFPHANPIYYITNRYVVRKKIVDKRYLIIFIVIQNFVFVYNIIDGRRNITPTDLFK